MVRTRTMTQVSFGLALPVNNRYINRWTGLAEKPNYAQRLSAATIFNEQKTNRARTRTQDRLALGDAMIVNVDRRHQLYLDGEQLDVYRNQEAHGFRGSDARGKA